MLEHYIKAFGRLHTDISAVRWTTRTCHRAPHKPLLLLSVMDLVAEGSITANLVELSTELAELFALYWAQTMPPDRRSNLALPFFHLQSDGFWHLVSHPGQGSVLSAFHQIRSIAQLRTLVLGAELDHELYDLLCVEGSRDMLRGVLLDIYFDQQTRVQLLEQSAVNIESFHYSQELLEKAQTRQVQEQGENGQSYRAAVRDQGFRRAVVTAYNHRCAVCGIRMLTGDGHTAVDAAHIVPWSLSQNDDPRNGMALCRLCHWTFDEGLIGVSSRYNVVVSPQLVEDQNMPGHLVTMEGRGILGPLEEALWPDPEALRWHRHNVLRRG